MSVMAVQKINHCTIAHKYSYNAHFADRKYRQKLRDSRTGINMINRELHQKDKVISPLIEQGQSPYHILINHPELDMSVRTMYSYLNQGLFTARDIDLKRKVRFKPRKCHKTSSFSFAFAALSATLVFGAAGFHVMLVNQIQQILYWQIKLRLRFLHVLFQHFFQFFYNASILSNREQYIPLPGCDGYYLTVLYIATHFFGCFIFSFTSSSTSISPNR